MTLLKKDLGVKLYKVGDKLIPIRETGLHQPLYMVYCERRISGYCFGEDELFAFAHSINPEFDEIEFLLRLVKENAKMCDAQPCSLTKVSIYTVLLVEHLHPAN